MVSSTCTRYLFPLRLPGLQPNRLLCPWGCSKQEFQTGLPCSPPGDFPTQGLKPGLLHCRHILFQLSMGEAQEYWNGQPIPFLGDFPDPGIKPESPALQVDSLPAELPGEPQNKKKSSRFSHKNFTATIHIMDQNMLCVSSLLYLVVMTQSPERN